MEKIIYKYPLGVVGEQTISLPKNSQTLTVQNQKGIPCLWALVDKDQAESEKRIIITYPTGDPIYSISYQKYIGTYQLSGGDLVYHVFESTL